MYIGLIAHDAKKKLMQNFCIAYRGILSKHELYATGTTGRLIEEVTNLTLHKYLPGHLGLLAAGELKKCGVRICNEGISGQVRRDRNLLTGDSPLASNALGRLAAETMLQEV